MNDFISLTGPLTQDPFGLKAWAMHMPFYLVLKFNLTLKNGGSKDELITTW